MKKNVGDILIELKRVNAAYNGELVLKNVNLTIYAHDFIGVIGPNGGGKTTLVKIILKLLKPVSGKVEYFMGTRPEHLPIGYLPQISNIDRKFPINVLQVVQSGQMNNKRIVSNFSGTERDRVDSIMADMGLSDLRRKPIGELSGGQLQRVFLARAIVSSPELLILDEPNTFVDNAFENELYEKLRKLNHTMGIVIVSHDVGMISGYVKTIACVNRELYYHESNVITEEQLQDYNCPIQLITHGEIPHTVLQKHKH